MKLTKVQGIPNFFLDATSGIYYVRKMINGRQVWRTTGHTAYKSALRRYYELMKELSDAKSGWKNKKVPSLEVWWKMYREAKVKSAETWALEEGIMARSILPNFGKLGLDEITSNDIERHLQKRKLSGIAQGTVSREQSLMSAVFAAAVESDLIEKNPLKTIHWFPYTSRKLVVSLEDQAKLQKVMSPMFERWFLFVLGTGLRANEARNIDPAKDIKWDERMLHVRHGKGSYGAPKERTIPLLSPELLVILREQIEENDTPGNPQARRDRTGTLWNQHPTYFRLELRLASKRAKVEQISPHVLRHTFATRYLQGGGDIYILSKILGHSTMDMTQRHYAHLLTADHAHLSRHVDLGIQRRGRLLKIVGENH